jgi:nucleoside-triphosphatase THEP1
MSTDRPIAAIASASRPATEALLAAVVGRMGASGAKVAGVLAETPLQAGTCGAGILRNITSAQPFSIRASEPSSRTSCLLDAAGVIAAGHDVLDRIAESDLVVLSKFGKLEANGSGLLAAFEAAARFHKPVLTSVSDKHRAAWKAFAPSAADLPADEAALRDWCRVATGR